MSPIRQCTVEGCLKPLTARGLCGMHYERMRRHGTLHLSPCQRAPRKPRQHRKLTREGYAILFEPGHANAQASGHVLEHRKVMADAIGRPLVPGETVHHRNGDRQDNRLENLELWIDNHGRGGRVEDALAWAHEIIERYSSSHLHVGVK